MAVWESLLALGLISFLGMFLQAMTGYGENIVFQICWHLLSLFNLTSGSILEAVVILTIVQFPLLTTQCALQRQHINVRLAMVLAVSSAVSTVGGVELLVVASSGGRATVWLQRALGALFIAVFLWQLAAQLRTAQPARDGPLEPFASSGTFALVAATGFASGFTGGAFSLPGPPTMVMTMMCRIRKDEWRGTNACYMLLQLPVRAALLFCTNTSVRIDEPMLWWQCASALGLGLAGLALGNAIAPYASQLFFRLSLLLMMLLGGVTLATAGLGDDVTFYSVSTVLAVAILLAFAYAARSFWRSRRQRGATISPLNGDRQAPLLQHREKGSVC